VKILAFADPHVSHKNPVSRIDSYEDAAFDKLYQIAKLAIKLGARAVVCSGDFFHLKKGTPHHIVIKLLAWARYLDLHSIMVIGIAGNHDLQDNRLASLDQQPLGVLFESGLLYDAAVAPVDVNNEHLVAVVGLPYPTATDPESLRTLPAHHCRYGLLLIHAFCAPEGGEYFGEHIHDYASLAATGYDVIVCGHDHRDQGVQQVNGTWIINVGALLRGNLAQPELERDVKIAVITFEETITVQQVKLRARPAAEVFDLEAHAKQVEEASTVAAFLEHLEADLDGHADQPLTDRLARLDIPETVRARVRSYLDAAEQQT
jgi:DNA repair exonuclease SbcCD nuclease subunit